MNKDVVIFSTAEWASPSWTNKQHVAVEMAKLGYRVFYVEPIGLRRPTLSSQDAKRIWRRLRKAFQGPVKVRENIWVWSPLAVPFQSNRLARKCNALFLGLCLHFHLNRHQFARSLLWTYNPLTTRLLDLDRFEKVVYHCVDAIEAQPGMPAELLKEAEQELVRRSDVVFTTSPALAASRGKWNPNTHYFPNVADFDHFSSAMTDQVQVPADLAAIPGPRVGFVGAISEYKLDFALIQELASSHPEWSVILIGEVGLGDPWTSTKTLREFKNVHFLGPREYRDLPAYLKGFDVAILPNILNEYTFSMFPMKFFEYLAAGKPVVSVDLDAIRQYGWAVRIAKDRADFVAGVGEVIGGAGATLEQRLGLAREHTYSSRMKAMLTVLSSTVAAR